MHIFKQKGLLFIKCSELEYKKCTYEYSVFHQTQGRSPLICIYHSLETILLSNFFIILIKKIDPSTHT